MFQQVREKSYCVVCVNTSLDWLPDAIKLDGQFVTRLQYANKIMTSLLLPHHNLTRFVMRQVFGPERRCFEEVQAPQHRPLLQRAARLQRRRHEAGDRRKWRSIPGRH